MIAARQASSEEELSRALKNLPAPVAVATSCHLWAQGELAEMGDIVDPDAYLRNRYENCKFDLARSESPSAPGAPADAEWVASVRDAEPDQKTLSLLAKYAFTRAGYGSDTGSPDSGVNQNVP